MSLVVLVTVPPERAHELARALVNEHLAASVNIIGSLQSVYRWDGDVVEDPESLLVIKTAGEKYPDLEERIHSLHPYEVPEIVALPVDRSSQKYQDWLRVCLEKPQR